MCALLTLKRASAELDLTLFSSDDEAQEINLTDLFWMRVQNKGVFRACPAWVLSPLSPCEWQMLPLNIHQQQNGQTWKAHVEGRVDGFAAFMKHRFWRGPKRRCEVCTQTSWGSICSSYSSVCTMLFAECVLQCVVFIFCMCFLLIKQSTDCVDPFQYKRWQYAPF